MARNHPVLPRSALPLPLREIPDPPKRLYCAGHAAALDTPAVAVVGSRRCTRQGRDTAFALSRDLAGQGLTIVSGLAYGIDAAAHRGALASAGAPTVAVLGSGLDRIYPQSHERLAAEIVDHGGALVSEYEPATGPRRHHFPARNRIVSGLCLGVVIVEA
ncbi:MAG: DNA-processing protein DprA, partial [Gammaproteobacteria bacterium]|nr:DNA-processing protein DprA [Gammaproteobacteria bacterium]